MHFIDEEMYIFTVTVDHVDIVTGAAVYNKPLVGWFD